MATAETEQPQYLDTLRETGYVSFPVAISGADIDPLFEQFREFSAIAWPEREDGESDERYADRCDAGQELVNAMHYKVPERPHDADYFMIHRRPGQTNEFSRTVTNESKDFLHTGPMTLTYARERLGRRMPFVMKNLLESCAEIHEAAKAGARPVFRELGIEDLLLAKNPMNDIHMVRVLRYLGTNASHQADLHFDRSTATMAVWESSPGLVGTPGNNALAGPMTQEEVDALAAQADVSPINHVSGEGKFFLGAGYNRLPGDAQERQERNGSVPLLAHGVINKQSDAERDAVVVFMNPHRHVEDYVVPSKAETSMSHLRASLAA